jgi:hypothetical protein
MEQLEFESTLRPLTYAEMIEVEGGFPWAAIFVGLAVNFMVNIPDFVNGLIAGWNAAHQ